MDIGSLLLMVGVAYGFGVFWYSLLPGSYPDHTWRVAAFPFFAIFLGETFLAFGPTFGGLHALTVVGASLVGTLVDWAIREARHPRVAHEAEIRPSPMGA